MEKKLTPKSKKSFREVLVEIEDREDWGKGSWSLPRNATTAEKVKYGICKKILTYQQDNGLTDEEITRRTHLTQSEIEDILFYRISKFSLDNLVNIASCLFDISEMEVVIEPKKIK